MPSKLRGSPCIKYTPCIIYKYVPGAWTYSGSTLMFQILRYICGACSAAGHAPWSCFAAHWAAFSPWSNRVGRCWSFTQHGGTHWQPYVKLWGITLSEPYYQFTVVLRVNTLNTSCIESSHLTLNSNLFSHWYYTITNWELAFPKPNHWFIFSFMQLST